MIVKIAGFYFFYFAAVGVYVIYMPSLLKGLGYTPFEIGAVFAAGPLSRFASPFFFISWLHLNRKTFVNALIASTLIGIAIAAGISHFWVMLALMVLLGFFWSILLPFVEVMALEHIGKERYGKARLFGSVGFIAVSLGLGAVALGLGLSMAVYVGSIALTMVFGLMLASLVEKEIVRQPGKLARDNLHLPFWVALFLMQMGFGFFYNFYTIYESEHGIPMHIISYLWTFGVLIEIVMFNYQKRVLGLDLLFLIKLSVFLGGVRWLMVHAFPEVLWVAYAAQSLHAFSFALLHTASIAYINTHYYHNRQLAQQFYTGLTFGLGAFAGSLLSGVLYGEHIFLYAALITFAGWGILLKERNQ